MRKLHARACRTWILTCECNIPERAATTLLIHDSHAHRIPTARHHYMPDARGAAWEVHRGAGAVFAGAAAAVVIVVVVAITAADAAAIAAGYGFVYKRHGEIEQSLIRAAPLQ